MKRPRDRRRASALQRSLERYERLLADGTDPADASAEIAGSLEATDAIAARMFAVATGLRDVARPDVEPSEAFRVRVTNLIRAEAVPSRGAVRRVPARRRLGLVPLGAAACVLVFAALLVPSMSSLPGDRLYGMKGFSEDARLLFATGQTEARVRVDLAEERFSEVEKLIDRSAVQAIGTYAAAPADIPDERLAQLIETALLEAGAHLEAAADIMTAGPTPASDLDELVAVSRRGHELATQVAEDLPDPGPNPVLSTVVKLAKIEAAAKAARTEPKTAATPPPCATPTPTPEPTPEADADVAATETATPTAVESATPSPTATPEPTPCTTPEPTPTPSPTPEPAAEESPEPSGTPSVEESVDGNEGGDEASDAGSTDSDGPSGVATARQQPA